MNLYSDRLFLRAPELSDSSLLNSMINDPDVENYTGGWSFPISAYQQQKWFESIQSQTTTMRLIVDTKEHGPIGLITLSDLDFKNRTAQLHIKLENNHQIRSKGYGSEATKTLVDYAFNQLDLFVVYSQVIEYNIASSKMLKNCGFIEEAVLKSRLYKNGNRYNIIVFSKCRENK